MAMMPSLMESQQLRRPALGVAAGPASYDLSGTGTSFVIAVNAEYSPLKPVIWEARLVYFQYKSQADINYRILMPEIGVQVFIPVGSVQPYLGVGAGISTVVSGPKDTELTLHTAFGLRVIASRNFGLRGEIRIRSVDPWSGTIADFTGGLTYSF